MVRTLACAPTTKVVEGGVRALIQASAEVGLPRPRPWGGGTLACTRYFLLVPIPRPQLKTAAIAVALYFLSLIHI